MLRNARETLEVLMARVTKGNKGVSETITVESSVRFPAKGGTNVKVTVNRIPRSWWTPSLMTAHAGVYAAAVIAMRDAEIRGVTHLTLSTRSNLVRRQLTGDWSTCATHLAGAQAIYMLFRSDFDDVDWVKSPPRKRDGNRFIMASNAA